MIKKIDVTTKYFDFEVTFRDKTQISHSATTKFSEEMLEILHETLEKFRVDLRALEKFHSDEFERLGK